jgi:transcriptional regulator of aromatic amino acid metabolism
MSVPSENALSRSVESFGAFSREAFRVGVALVRAGAAADEPCPCPLAAGARPPAEECRAFAAALPAAERSHRQCPGGLNVVARPVGSANGHRLLLVSEGFLEDGRAPGAAAADPTARLAPAEVRLLGGYLELAAGVIGELVHATDRPARGWFREELWRDLLGAPSIVGSSPAAHALREALPSAANSREPLFIAGEPGSGRRLLAAAVHRAGTRAARPFVSEDLARVPEGLRESGLFGAGAEPGLIAEAGRGTLYIASIELLPPAAQARLADLLARGGSGAAARSRPRIIASANRDLQEAARRGRFRRDLSDRLTARTLQVPPLRERPEDIGPIAQHLLRRRAAALGIDPPRLEPGLLDALKMHSWTGNVRELDEELALAATGRSAIGPEHLSPAVAQAGRARADSGTRLRDAVGELESTLIAQALAESNWNKSRAARSLGLSRLGLQKKIDRYEIDRRR